MVDPRGMYTGKAPVLLTELQPANETVLSINEAFNLLRFMEFASDRWWRSYAEWHGEGVVLGRVPLIRGLGLREVVGVKAVRSTWDGRHESVTAMHHHHGVGRMVRRGGVWGGKHLQLFAPRPAPQNHAECPRHARPLGMARGTGVRIVTALHDL